MFKQLIYLENITYLHQNLRSKKPELFQTWQINVCERAVYNEKEGTIDILFTGSIMEYLKQRTKNFTLYNLKEVADLTSIYAVRIYELMQQFSSTTGMLIHSIEKWREILGVQPTQYKLYGHLKDKVFNQALEEINLKTGYNLVMTEIKEGRKVVRVQFDFAPDMVYTGTNPRTGEIVDRHIKPKVKKLTAEEKAKLEAKRAKQKEYRERHKAKKLAATENPEIIRDLAEYALQKEFEEAAFTDIHPDQLEKRWNYTRQGINLRIKQDYDFPKPYTIINNGKTKIWLLSDIVDYENLRTNLVRRLEDSAFNVYCRSKEDYAKLTEDERKILAGNNPYSKLNTSIK
ncbi:replication initiator protein [Stylonychia lemnae]|uniref:Replication initiator protein n=1 Tax=Stylonychia lemnae TaxID=5949 RepID=A0A078ALS9_STYLE|nr:replication initiator protein [Stylonychia lemnae]|eukprot:CDW83310.1 replication initiator protein [Stylonychia lemnae]